VTTALLVALRADDRGDPACLGTVADQRILDRVIAQTRGLGADSVVVITRASWRDQLAPLEADDTAVIGVSSLAEALRALAEHAGPARTLLAHADIVTHDGALAGLLLDPRLTNGVLVDTADGAHGGRQPRLRAARGRVVAAESAYHDVDPGDSRFLGLLFVSANDLDTLSAVAEDLADLLADGPPSSWSEAHRGKIAAWSRPVVKRRSADVALAGLLAGREDQWGVAGTELREAIDRDLEAEVVRPLAELREDPLSLLLVGLVRRDVVVGAAWVRELYWGRPTTDDERARSAVALERIDEDRVQLDSAVKATDGFFTTYFVSPYSKYIARWAARRGLTPNQVTTFSMLLGILAAAAFATGRQPWMIVGALLLQAAFTFDCVDGQLARYTRSFSKLGAWLDSVFDRGKEYVVYAGLAIGAVANGDTGAIWAWATAALALQTVRHFVDFAYAAQQHLALDVSVAAPLDRPAERGPTRWERMDDAAPRSLLQRLGAAGVRASQRAESRAGMKWLKRAFVLPIGERFALISLTAAIWGPRITFLSLLIWGSIAALYTVSGRVARSLV